jgi:hypothetical protein
VTPEPLELAERHAAYRGATIRRARAVVVMHQDDLVVPRETEVCLECAGALGERQPK